ncbi:MAG TPA: protein phosphatase 2C domain-containing protein [Acetobacteraceae bacterium]
MIRVLSSSLTHVGAVRSHNEDALVDRPDLGIWAVADGAGGHQAGEVAAGMIVEALCGVPPGLSAAEALAEIRTRIDTVHRALLHEAARRGPGVAIASTAVVMCVRGTHYACLWAGDSRAYCLRNGELFRVTHDHSLVQELVDAGVIGEHESEGHPQANVITRAVGAGDEETLLLDKAMDTLEPGDRYLLCSDGLTKSVPERDIAAELSENRDDAARRLIEIALERQVNDNVTAIVLDVVAESPAPDDQAISAL